MTPGFKLRDTEHKLVRALMDKFGNATCKCKGTPLLKLLDTKLLSDEDASMMSICPRCNKIHMFGCFYMPDENITAFLKLN